MAQKTIPQLNEIESIDENAIIPVDTGIQSYKITAPNLSSSLKKFSFDDIRWKSTLDYPAGAIVTHNNNFWYSTAPTTAGGIGVNHPYTYGSNWKLIPYQHITGFTRKDAGTISYDRWGVPWIQLSDSASLQGWDNTARPLFPGPSLVHLTGTGSSMGGGAAANATNMCQPAWSPDSGTVAFGFTATSTGTVNCVGVTQPISGVGNFLFTAPMTSGESVIQVLWSSNSLALVAITSLGIVHKWTRTTASSTSLTKATLTGWVTSTNIIRGCVYKNTFYLLGSDGNVVTTGSSYHGSQLLSGGTFVGANWIDISPDGRKIVTNVKSLYYTGTSANWSGAGRVKTLSVADTRPVFSRSSDMFTTQSNKVYKWDPNTEEYIQVSSYSLPSVASNANGSMQFIDGHIVYRSASPDNEFRAFPWYSTNQSYKIIGYIGDTSALAVAPDASAVASVSTGNISITVASSLHFAGPVLKYDRWY